MSIIICPNCKSILQRLDKTVRCDKGHSFDVSKDGYINLLLPHQKKKLNPGDNKIMMNAREAFLSTGHYDLLIDQINKSIESLKTEHVPLHFLDIGCGTGYYTRQILKNDPLTKIGLDISKQGITKASKKDKEATYIVGSAFDIPIQLESVDIAMSIFSPIQIQEVHRVLKKDGIIIKVIPSQDHMKEVAALIYDKLAPHDSSIITDLEKNGFKIISEHTIDNKVSLKDQILHSFIRMTPYLYKFKEGAIEELKELSVSLSFKIIIAEKIES